MKQTATVIFFSLPGKINYIGDMSVRPDNKIVPIYTSNIEEAHEYEDDEHAQKIINRIHNPHNRSFNTMTKEVTVRRKKLFIHPSFEELK